MGAFVCDENSTGIIIPKFVKRYPKRQIQLHIPCQCENPLPGVSLLDLLKRFIQRQLGIEGSSKNYWSRGVGCVRLLPDSKWREVVSRIQHQGTSYITTSRNKPCCICFTIPHKYFTDKQVENVRNYS